MPGLPLHPPIRTSERMHNLDYRGRLTPGPIPATRRQVLLPDDWRELPRELTHLAGKVAWVSIDRGQRARIELGPFRAVIGDPRAIGLARTDSAAGWQWWLPWPLLAATRDALRALRRA